MLFFFWRCFRLASSITFSPFSGMKEILGEDWDRIVPVVCPSVPPDVGPAACLSPPENPKPAPRFMLSSAADSTNELPPVICCVLIQKYKKSTSEFPSWQQKSMVFLAPVVDDLAHHCKKTHKNAHNSCCGPAYAMKWEGMVVCLLRRTAPRLIYNIRSAKYIFFSSIYTSNHRSHPLMTPMLLYVMSVKAMSLGWEIFIS